MDKDLKELDYELCVQDLVETASSHKCGDGLEIHLAVAIGQLEDIKYLVEKKHCNPMQRHLGSFAPFHVAAIVGNVQVLKYFITECNCNPACPGSLGLTPLHLASGKIWLSIWLLSRLINCVRMIIKTLHSIELADMVVRQSLSFLPQNL